MIDVDAAAVGSRARRLTWMLGGGLLAASALLGLAPQSLPGIPNLDPSTLLFAAGAVIFAMGWGRAGSVTARRPLGTSAIIVLAAWLVVSPLLAAFWSQAWIPEDSAPSDGAISDLTVLVTSVEVISLMLAIIAVMQIARSGVVPAPWKWAPLWALLAVVAARMLPSAIALGDPSADQIALSALFDFAGLLQAASIAFLGVLAMVLAARPTPGSTTVYDSAG